MLRETQVARYWDGNAAAWSAGLARGDDLFRHAFHEAAFRRWLGPLEGQHVLDAGCGDGHLTRQLAAAGARVVAVDLSEKMLEVAIEEEARRPLGIRYRKESYTRLSGLRPRSFDTVVAFMSLMDGPDLKGALDAFRRVLKPRGALVFAVLHPCFFTPSLGWWRDPKDGVPRLQVSHYFDRQPRVQTWRFPGGAAGEQPFAVPRFPRTLSDYVEALTDAAFTLRGLSEPRPSAAACRRYPMLAAWKDHAAAFLHVRATLTPIRRRAR